jgi:hypothetical protein
MWEKAEQVPAEAANEILERFDRTEPALRRMITLQYALDVARLNAAAADHKAYIRRVLEILRAALRQSGCDGDLCAYQWHEDARSVLHEAETA